jgi:hypothetical protein
MNASTTSRRTRFAQVLLFANPELWPTRPFLALTRRHPDTNEIEYGVLYDARGASGLYGYSSTVFSTNLFQLPDAESEFLKLPRHTYDTFEEIADDGWIAL